MPHLLDPLTFSHGPSMKNRFMLAPLTNQQSHELNAMADELARLLPPSKRGRRSTGSHGAVG